MGPSAEHPSIEHPSTLSEQQLQALIWVSISIIFLVLAGRLALRIRYRQRLFLDDYLLLLAFSLTTVMGVMHTLSLPPLFIIREGGMPSLEHMRQLLVVQFIAKIFFWLNVYSVKLSLLAFLRTFLHALPSSRKYWYLSLILVSIGFVGSFIGNITECTPIGRNFSVEDGCASADDLQNSRILLTSLTSWDIMTDLAIIILPLPLLASMRQSLNKRQLASLAGVFSTGGLITIFSCLRLARIWSNRPIEDFPWQVTIAITWAQIEAAIAIFVGCSPAFKVLLVKERRKGRVVGELRTWADHEDSQATTAVTDTQKTEKSTMSKVGPEMRIMELPRASAEEWS